MTSPTQRSLKLMRDLGYHIGIVEKWNAFARIRVDLFGWIDLVATKPDEIGILGIQTTTQANIGARLAKAKGNPALVSWLVSGCRLRVHGWRKLKGRWQVDSRDVTLSDIT